MKDCCLCDLKGSFLRVTFCKTCHELILVHVGHKTYFSAREKHVIRMMFPDARIRWRMRSVRDHAHCHLYLN